MIKSKMETGFQVVLFDIHGKSLPNSPMYLKSYGTKYKIS